MYSTIEITLPTNVRDTKDETMLSPLEKKAIAMLLTQNPGIIYFKKDEEYKLAPPFCVKNSDGTEISYSSVSLSLPIVKTPRKTPGKKKNAGKADFFI